MSDKGSEFTRGKRPAVEEEEQSSQMNHQREFYERSQAEMNNLSTASMESSSESPRKRQKNSNRSQAEMNNLSTASMESSSEGRRKRQKNSNRNTLAYEDAVKLEDTPESREEDSSKEGNLQAVEGIAEVGGELIPEVNTVLGKTELVNECQEQSTSIPGRVKRKRSYSLPAAFDDQDLYEKAGLMDKPEHFSKLSRVEKLSLVLNPDSDSFINKDLETLLYGPIHLKLGLVWNKKPVTRRGKTRKPTGFLSFNSEPGICDDTLEPQRNKKVDELEPKKRLIIYRTKFTLKTLDNWCEYKTLGPEKIIVNIDYLVKITLRDDVNDALRNDVNDEDEDVKKLMSFLIMEADHGTKWENMSVDVICGFWTKEFVDSDSDSDGSSIVEIGDGDEDVEMADHEESQENKLEEDKESQENQDPSPLPCDELSPPSPNEGSTSNDGTSSNLGFSFDKAVLCSPIKTPFQVKVEELTYNNTRPRVSIQRLRELIKEILDETLFENKENRAGPSTQRAGPSTQPDESEGAVAMQHTPNFVMFADVLVQIFNRLDSASAADLTPHIAFVALLHVASENGLLLTNHGSTDNDVMIIKESEVNVVDNGVNEDNQDKN